MLNCHQVSKLVSTDQVQDLGMMKKLEYHMHLFICVHCKRYVQQIRSIGRGARDNVTHLEADAQQLQRMENRVLKDVRGKG